jgi:hypothetical protein
LILKILRGKYPPLPGKYSQRLKRLLEACLRKESSRRPSLTQILASSPVYAKARELGLEMPPEVEALRATATGKSRPASAIGLDSDHKQPRRERKTDTTINDGKGERRMGSPLRSPATVTTTTTTTVISSKQSVAAVAVGRGGRAGGVAPAKGVAAAARGGRVGSASHARVLSSGGGPIAKPPIPVQQHHAGGGGGISPAAGAAAVVPVKRPSSDRPRVSPVTVSSSAVAVSANVVVTAAAKRNAIAKPLGSHHQQQHVSQIRVEPKFAAGFDHLPVTSIHSSISTPDLTLPRGGAGVHHYASGGGSYSPASMASHFQTSVANDAPRAIAGKPGVSLLHALTRTAEFDHSFLATSPTTSVAAAATATIVSAPGSLNSNNGSTRVSPTSATTIASMTVSPQRRLASLANSLNHDGTVANSLASTKHDQGYDDEFDDGDDSNNATNGHGETQYLDPPTLSGGVADGSVTWRVKDDLEGSYEEDDEYGTTATRDKLSAAIVAANNNAGVATLPSSSTVNDDDDNERYHRYADDDNDEHYGTNDDNDEDDELGDGDVAATSVDELSEADHEWLALRIPQLNTAITAARNQALMTPGMTSAKFTALHDYFRRQAEEDIDDNKASSTAATAALQRQPFEATSEIRGVIFRLLSLESELNTALELSALSSAR